MEVLSNQSLRTKMIGVFSIPTLLIVLLYGFLAYFVARQGLEDELGKRLVSVGQAVSAELSDGFAAKQIVRLDADSTRVRKRLRQRLRRTREATEVKRLYLFDRQRRNLVHTEGPRSFHDELYKLKANRYEIEETFESAEPTTSILFKGRDGTLHKSAYVPITLGDRVVAALGVEASAEYFDLLRNFASALTILGAIGLGLVVLAGTLFSRALTRPVNRLVEAARRLGEGELEEPVVEIDDEDETERQRDEIAFLAQSFEDMRRDVQSRDQQMKMMLSGIAHEVRNPLGGMELFCGLLRSDLEDANLEDADDLLEKVDRIERELDYLDRVVDEFRDFAGDTSLERERFATREMMTELENLLAGDVREAGCTLEVSIEDDLELTADRERLRRVVLNLVRNAYQACEEGSTIEVDIEALDESMRRITVRDDGPGISDETLEEMFTPFYTTKEKGSGLGMPLSQEIVEAHDGTLEVDTEVGEGTTVTIELPFDDSIESTQQDVPEGWLG